MYLTCFTCIQKACIKTNSLCASYHLSYCYTFDSFRLISSGRSLWASSGSGLGWLFRDSSSVVCESQDGTGRISPTRASKDTIRPQSGPGARHLRDKCSVLLLFSLQSPLASCLKRRPKTSSDSLGFHLCIFCSSMTLIMSSLSSLSCAIWASLSSSDFFSRSSSSLALFFGWLGTWYVSSNFE